MPPLQNGIPGFTLQIPPVLDLTDDMFYALCSANRDLQLERTANGEIMIMTPTGGGTGWRNYKLTTAIGIWAEENDTGLVFDSSTGFILPNGATRSPDVAWVAHERLARIPEEQKEKFLPLCPDFVLELRSPSDGLKPLHEKMQEYMDNGARLGWLIDPKNKRVYISRPGNPVECLENPEILSGEDVLPELAIEIRKVWKRGF